MPFSRRKEADEEMLEQAQDGEMNNCVSQAMQDQLRDTLGLTPAYLKTLPVTVQPLTE